LISPGHGNIENLPRFCAGAIRPVTPDLVNVAKEVVHADQLVWIVVGDRSKIESGIRGLGWGEIQFLDADGHPAK